MPTYDAGAATGRYILDTSQAERSLAAMSKRLQDFEALQKRVLSGRGGSGGGVSVEEVKIQQALARRASAEARLASEANKRLLIDQRIAQSGAQTALAEQRRQTELAKTANAEARAAASALRLQQQRERAARAGQNGGLGPALPRTFAGFTGEGFNQALGAFGLATIGPQIVGQAVGAAVDAGKAALDLQRVQALTKALSGDQATYNNVVKAAREQQTLYGGSLADNIQKLSGLVTASRSSGAELETLINLSQRLAILDPAQGLEGAQIALREALSGDTRSLALRFEIPRAALVKLKDESIPVAERLLVIDQYLNKIGISGDVAAKTISDQAKAYNALNAELDTFKTNLGAGLSDAFAKPADGLARLIGLINSNPEAIATYLAIINGRDVVTGEDVTRAAKGVAERAARSSLGAGGAGGIPDRQAFAQQQLGGADQFANALERTAQIQFSGTDEARAAVTKLNQELLAGSVAGDAYFARLAEIEGATSRVGGAWEDAAGKAKDAAAQQQAVQQAVDLVRAGAIDQAGAVALLQSQYPGLADEADALISKQLQLADAADKAARALGQQRLADQKANTRTLGSIGSDKSRPGAVGNDVGDFLKFLDDQQRAQDERDRTTAEFGTTAEKTALAQRNYNDAVKEFGKDSAEAIAAERELKRVREANKGNAGGTRRTGEIKDAQDLVRLEDDLRGRLEQRRRAILDVGIAQAQDSIKRREEDQRIASARRVLADAGTSAEQKAQAQDVLALVPLERQRRELDLQAQAREAQQGVNVSFPAGAVQVMIDGKVVEARVVTNFRGAVASSAARGGL